MARNDKAIIIPGVPSDDWAALTSGLNYTTETVDRRAGCTSSTFTATAQLRFAAAPIREGDTINSLAAFCVAVGSAVTLFDIGVYDRNFNLVASTADIKAQLVANTWMNGAVATPWTSTYSGVVWLGVHATYTTTSPTFAIATGAVNSNLYLAPIPGTSGITWAQTGPTTLPATATPAFGSGMVPVVVAS